LFSDSTKAELLKPTDFVWENNRTTLLLTRPIAAKRELKLILPKATFFSIENDTIAASTYKLAIMEEENFGALQGEIKGIAKASVGHKQTNNNPTDTLSKNKKFIVELLDEKYEVIKSVANKTPFEFNYIKPAATYYLRVIVDENANGRWDAGDFKTKRLAEPIIFHLEPIKLKKNFVLSGIDIDLSTK